MKTVRNLKVWDSFVIKISLVILLFILGIYIGIFVQHKILLDNEVLIRARSHFASILLTRRWSAEYGGVYVEKTPGVVSNPYLKNPDFQSTDGKTYTKKNPALITREISELATLDKSFQYHITSLCPLNPNNKPDEFETQAFQRFEEGVSEVYATIHEGDKTYFRYMAPLFTEASCLQCHGEQGYEVNDIRGGISVTLDTTHLKKSYYLIFFEILALGILTILILLGIIYTFIYKLKRQLTETQTQLEVLSVTDELTKLFNRRHFFEKFRQEMERAKRYQHPLSCVMLDIDFFKKVNDQYGHQAGDRIIQKVAALLKETTRQSDIAARYGGEEFVLLLPETDGESALAVAEKIRQAVENSAITLDNGQTTQCTVSLGVASVPPAALSNTTNCDSLINQADMALYQAKQSGRNRSILAP
ncbi:MAG: diguanylate cyclase [bacterium]|jgi:diguanylate cyclase (GGDEF)-like protein|nr:diguanylate cyclase [bacterium]